MKIVISLRLSRLRRQCGPQALGLAGRAANRPVSLGLSDGELDLFWTCWNLWKLSMGTVRSCAAIRRGAGDCVQASGWTKLLIFTFRGLVFPSVMMAQMVRAVGK